MEPITFNPDKLFPSYSLFPLELTFHITSFLDVKDLATSETLSRDWKIVSTNSLIWKNIYRKHFPHRNHMIDVMNWKEEFKKTYPRENYLERIVDLCGLYIDLQDYKNKPLQKHQQQKVDEINSQIPVLQNELRFYNPHLIHYFFFNDLIDKVPTFNTSQKHFNVKAENMENNPIMKGTCKENGSYFSIQVYTDKEMKTKDTITFISWPTPKPHLMIFGLKLGMVEMIHDYAINYPKLLAAMQYLIREGEIDLPSSYYKIVNFDLIKLWLS